MKGFCVLGSANLDMFLNVSHIPLPGETLQADNSFTAFGGKGANQAVAAGLLGSQTFFLGQVGHDGSFLLNFMRDCNVDVSNVEIKKDQNTGFAIIHLSEDKQNSITIWGGANMNWYQLQENFIKKIEESKILLLQKEVPININIQALKVAKSKGVIRVLDCGGRSDIISEEMLGLLDFISPNETELERLLADLNIKTSEELVKKFPNLKLLIKLGERGCVLIGSQGFEEVRVSSVTQLNPEILQKFQIQDTTGAGDCFTSAFFVRLLELDSILSVQNLKKAMVFANSAAFLCITKLGAMPSMPKRQDVDKFIKDYLSDYY